MAIRLHKGQIYSKLPNTSAKLGLNKGQLYNSIWSTIYSITLSFYTETMVTEHKRIIALNKDTESHMAPITSGAARSACYSRIETHFVRPVIINAESKVILGRTTKQFMSPLCATIYVYKTDYEWVPLGVFWSGDWSAPEDGVHVQTTGRDRLDMLRGSTYSTSTVQINKTLHDLAIEVLADSGLAENDFWVDTELKDFVVPYSYFTSQAHREALRKIAEACLGQVYCDRNGVIRVEGPSFTENKIAQALGAYFLEGAYPAEIESVEAHGIGPEDYFKKDNPARDNEIANYIEVETQPLKPDVIQEVYRSNEPVSITAGQVKTMTVFYNETPCMDATASLEGEGTIDSAIYYAWGANIRISSVASGSFTLVINAKPLKVMNKEKAVAQDKDSITDNGLVKYVFPGNPFVQTIDVAQKIADKLLKYYKDPRRDVTMNWRGNPALELGDIITVPDYQKGAIDQRGYYYITKQDMEYTGALRAKLEGRRAL